MPMKQNKAINEKCLTCAMCDDSDIPNLFCKLNSELINVGDYRYCPKKPREVINFIEKQDNKIKRLLDYTSKPRNIRDPWYTGNFEETYDDVTEGCKAFLNSLNL